MALNDCYIKPQEIIIRKILSYCFFLNNKKNKKKKYPQQKN